MKFGVFLPISGRAAGPDTLMEAARSAEAQGFDAVWSADRVVTPWQIHTSYPYSENHEFIVPPDRPFLDSLTCLAFLAGCTEKITLGISVLVLPYRHPLYWTRVAASIEQLSKGRLIMGVGVGWMEEEFASLGVPFKDRGRMTDEQLQILSRLWTEEHASFNGQFYRFQDLAFYPKPIQQPRIPIWGRRRRCCSPASCGQVRRCLVSLLRSDHAGRVEGRVRQCPAPGRRSRTRPTAGTADLLPPG
jgi:alkanesulfonate monooxygenase SsuD/methylene tetrahydromethanopterin reductase-like flavin-dependent oxidoreductase (luciferase family)